MKDLIYEDKYDQEHKLKFQVWEEINDNCSFCHTKFFLGEKSIFRKKYYLFGKVVEEKVPEYEFTISGDIKSPEYEKHYWRDEIEKELKKFRRLKQIERGEYI